jgi:signal transduction histidine kinase
MRKVYTLIAASALALALLIFFQMRWIGTSRALIEEQFTNKVNLALCSAVEQLSESEDCRQTCLSMEGCSVKIQALSADSLFSSVLKSKLEFYQVDLPFEVNIAVQDTAAGTAPPYSCSLMPLLAKDDHWLQLIFQGKKDYFNQRNGMMVTASMLILFGIGVLFTYAAYWLVRQQKLSEANLQFFNHMTHEFRTPLTNIQLASRMMKKKSTSGSDPTYLNIIDSQCDHLRHQVDNVLHMATLEKENFRLEMDEVDLRELAREVVDGMSMQIQDKKASVEITTSGQPCHIRGDRFHLRNVFHNLIENALKYSPSLPRIEIGFFPFAQGWCARVRDHGPGIRTEENEKIFQPFYRGGAAESPIRGFGMGLAYVKKILDLHQGQIRVETAPSQGTCFEMYFPKA